MLLEEDRRVWWYERNDREHFGKDGISQCQIPCKQIIHFNFFFYIHNNLDLFIVETWLNGVDLTPIMEAKPAACDFFSSPRNSGQGGGLAIIFNKSFKCRLLN